MLSADCGEIAADGICELLDDGNGLLVAMRSVNAVKPAMSADANVASLTRQRLLVLERSSS